MGYGLMFAGTVIMIFQAKPLLRCKKIILLLSLSSTVWSGVVFSLDREVPGCGTLENAYGPWDYTNPIHLSEKLAVVNTWHFTKSVENLVKGKSGSVISDIDYTLRASPNHHRALMSMANYRLKHPWQPFEQYRSAECYFKRALAFKPDDGYVYLVYGIYQYKRKKYKEAESLYLKALEIMPDNADLNNNLALLYLKTTDYIKARKYAEQAYSYGFQLRGVEEILKDKGKW